MIIHLGRCRRITTSRRTVKVALLQGNVRDPVHRIGIYGETGQGHEMTIKKLGGEDVLKDEEKVIHRLGLKRRNNRLHESRIVLLQGQNRNTTV